jgi:succinate dehydrogenase / fumarate reductase cytochrome b subunit
LLSGNFIIKAVSWILLLTLIAHSVYALIITRRNAAAAGVRYAHDQRAAVSTWSSRNMGLLGTIILIFLVIHYKDFWYPYSFGHMPLDSNGHKDLYGIVVGCFRQWWYVLLYELSFVALGYHLLHGFFSAARTLGVYHPKYEKGVRMLGKAYTVLITAGFMFIPIYAYFKL